MATKRKTGIKFQTFKHDATITYSATEVGGSVHANKHFTVKSTGNGEVGLAGAGDAILGELFDVSADGNCLVAVEGQGLQGLSGGTGANGVAATGVKVVGGTGPSVGGQTGGYIKTAGADVDGRAYVTDTAGATASAVVTYNL